MESSGSRNMHHQHHFSPHHHGHHVHAAGTGSAGSSATVHNGAATTINGVVVDSPTAGSQVSNAINGLLVLTLTTSKDFKIGQATIEIRGRGFQRATCCESPCMGVGWLGQTKVTVSSQ